jgi:actin-related protein 2
MSLGSLPCVVCDNGTGFVKVGYAGQNFPSFIYPSMIGRPMLRAEESISDTLELKEIMCGEEAAIARASLDIRWPVENGIIKNWEDMEHLWNYTFFEKLCINPTENKILLTEPPMNPVKNREALIQTMFEKYSFAAANVSIQVGTDTTNTNVTIITTPTTSTSSSTTILISCMLILIIF